jgi:hypothetical protein
MSAEAAGLGATAPSGTFRSPGLASNTGKPALIKAATSLEDWGGTSDPNAIPQAKHIATAAVRRNFRRAATVYT